MVLKERINKLIGNEKKGMRNIERGERRIERESKKLIRKEKLIIDEEKKIKKEKDESFIEGFEKEEKRIERLNGDEKRIEEVEIERSGWIEEIEVGNWGRKIVVKEGIIDKMIGINGRWNWILDWKLLERIEEKKLRKEEIGNGERKNEDILRKLWIEKNDWR